LLIEMLNVKLIFLTILIDLYIIFVLP
jgi:hypothetical protein